MEPLTGTSLRLNQALFVALALGFILLAMLPLGLPADAYPMPNLVFALALAWTIRRPASAPWGSILFVALMADILLTKPVGLWACLTLLSSELARTQRWAIREQMFPVEWALFAVVFAVALMVNGFALRIVFEPTPSIGLTGQYFASTVLAYPLIAGLLHYGLGVRSPRVAHQSKRLGGIS